MDKNRNGTAHFARARRVGRGLGTALALALGSFVVGAPGLAAATQYNAVTESILAVRPGDIVLGPAQAPVTIVTYTEHHNNGYAAPWLNSLRLLRQKYGSSVRIIVRDYIMAFHPDANLSAAAAHGVFERRGEAAYLNFVEALASPQCLFVPRYLAAEADRVGAGPAQVFEAALDSEVWAGRIATNKADVQAASLEGTPTIFINGQKYNDRARFDKITPAIDAELTAAHALEAQQGVHGARLSVERTRVNLAASAKLRAGDAAQEFPELKAPVKLVGNTAIGPFYLGQTYAEVKRLGYHMASFDGGHRVCVATNTGYLHPYCTFNLVFTGGALAQIDYFLDRTQVGVVVNGRSFPLHASFSELVHAIGSCSLGGGSTTVAQCRGGVSVYAKIGDGCDDAIEARAVAPRCRGERNVVGLRVGGEPAVARPGPGPAPEEGPRPGPGPGPRAAEGDATSLRTPPVFVPGRSFGPFALGQSYQDVMQLGFRVRQIAGRLCVATNPDDDLCTYFLVFNDNRLTRLDYNIDRATLGFKYNGRRIAQNTSYEELQKILGCIEGEIAEGGNSAVCPPGLGVSMGTGGRCGDNVAIQSNVPCGPGFMGTISVHLKAH